MTEITGTLRMARRDFIDTDDCRLRGQIYGDAKGRFRDGEKIFTSKIVSEEGDIFRTRSGNTYRIGSWADGTPTVAANTYAPAARAASINELVTYFHGKSRATGWWNDPVTDADLTTNPFVIATKLMLCVSELSEAMEGLRKNLMDDKLPHRKMAEVELGDALIRIADLAGALGYDLGNATIEKDAFNSVRPDHKPEARAAVGGKAY